MKDTQRSEYVFTVQQRIAELAWKRPEECFTALNHYLTVDWLKVAYERVKPDSAPGVDGQIWAEYGKNLDENLRDLLKRAKSGSYTAPLFRVSIFEVYFFMKKGGDLEWNFKLPSGLGGFG